MFLLLQDSGLSGILGAYAPRKHKINVTDHNAINSSFSITSIHVCFLVKAESSDSCAEDILFAHFSLKSSSTILTPRRRHDSGALKRHPWLHSLSLPHTFGE